MQQSQLARSFEGLTSPFFPAKFTQLWGRMDVANRRSATPCLALPNTKSLVAISSCSASRCSTTLQMSEQKPGCFSHSNTRKKSKAYPSSSFCARLSPPARALTFRSSSCGSLRWSGCSVSEWIPHSSTATSTKASQAVKRSATKSCRWRFSNQRLQFSTKPTPALTLMPCASLPPEFAKFEMIVQRWAS